MSKMILIIPSIITPAINTTHVMYQACVLKLMIKYEIRMSGQRTTTDYF